MISQVICEFDSQFDRLFRRRCRELLEESREILSRLNMMTFQSPAVASSQTDGCKLVSSLPGGFKQTRKRIAFSIHGVACAIRQPGVALQNLANIVHGKVTARDDQFGFDRLPQYGETCIERIQIPL